MTAYHARSAEIGVKNSRIVAVVDLGAPGDDLTELVGQVETHLESCGHIDPQLAVSNGVLDVEVADVWGDPLLALGLLASHLRQALAGQPAGHPRIEAPS